MANLYRQGNQAQAILVALGLGVMFTLTVYLVQDSVVSQVVDTAPPGAPNVFLVGVTDAQVKPLEQLIAIQKDILTPVEFVPRVAARLVSVDGASRNGTISIHDICHVGGREARLCPSAGRLMVVARRFKRRGSARRFRHRRDGQTAQYSTRLLDRDAGERPYP